MARVLRSKLEPERILVLAIPETASIFFKRRMASRLFETQHLKIIVVNIPQEVIVEWLPQKLV